VLASAVAGNVGMLGADYAGYFPWGDAPALAELILRCRSGDLLSTLAAQCRARAPLFDPATERAALRRLVHEFLEKA
jgi:hypothetical protein